MSLGELARSDAMIGSAEVFNSAPWLGRFVQFFISWAVIIGFLMFYFSYLCTLVFLSNKEFFRQVDEIKKGDQGGDNGRLTISGFIKAYKGTGGEAKKRLTGIDNIVIFVMMISPNFLAYSMYANVEPGETKDGQRFNFDDTMGQFFLKSLPQSVMILFILGMALSGLLLRILFQLSDVLTVQANRFANSNLQVWLDRMGMDFLLHDFQFPSWGTVSGDMANYVARRAMIQAVSAMPALSPDNQVMIGQQIEAEVLREMTNPENIFCVNRLVDLYNRRIPEESRDQRWTNGGERQVRVSHEGQMDLSVQRGFSVDVRVAAGEQNGVSHVFRISDMIENAGLTSPQITSNVVNVFVHFNMNVLTQDVVNTPVTRDEMENMVDQEFGQEG